MVSYKLAQDQINWLEVNLKDYSKMVKGTPDFVHIIDNDVNFENMAFQIQIHIVMEKEIVHYSLTRYGIESEIITNPMGLLGALSGIHQCDSCSSGEPCFDRVEFYLTMFLPDFLGIKN